MYWLFIRINARTITQIILKREAYFYYILENLWISQIIKAFINVKILLFISLENLALKGGILFCYNCFIINLKQPLLSYNKALVAGAIYLEYNSSTCDGTNITLGLNSMKITNLQTLNEAGMLIIDG